LSSLVQKIIRQQGIAETFDYFCIGLGQLFPRHKKKKKRYAYLVLENVGNFQIGYKDSIVVLTL
jgi:hypothetical protein